MNLFDYVMQVLPMFPTAALAALAIYIVLYHVSLKKRKKPTRQSILAEFTLVGWFVVFIYVTQLKSFGNGFGALYNLTPLVPFQTAFRFGSNNAGMIWQFLLNILMFVPLGFLLPIVFPLKCRTGTRVMLISFCTSLATELLQLVSKRGTDIDDLIANTVGGVCGFALHLVLYGAVTLAKKPKTPINRKFIAGMAVLAIAASPFLAISISDRMSPFGNLYYGHLRPTHVVLDTDVSTSQSTRTVYEYVELENITHLKERLKSASGLTDNYVLNGDVWVLSDGASKRISIFPYNRWTVHYAYGAEIEPDAALVPEEAEALEIAWRYLNTFGITAEEVSYSRDISTSYGDGFRHMEFVGLQFADSQMVYGSVVVSIGENGDLIDMDDRRITCKARQNVTCISPADAIEVAGITGVGVWEGTAHISSVDAGNAFIEETGLLVPTWVIRASFTAESGQVYEWSPVISAVNS